MPHGQWLAQRLTRIVRRYLPLRYRGRAKELFFQLRQLSSMSRVRETARRVYNFRRHGVMVQLDPDPKRCHAQFDLVTLSGWILHRSRRVEGLLVNLVPSGCRSSSNGASCRLGVARPDASVAYAPRPSAGSVGFSASVSAVHGGSIEVLLEVLLEGGPSLLLETGRRYMVRAAAAAGHATCRFAGFSEPLGNEFVLGEHVQVTVDLVFPFAEVAAVGMDCGGGLRGCEVTASPAADGWTRCRAGVDLDAPGDVVPRFEVTLKRGAVESVRADRALRVTHEARPPLARVDRTARPFLRVCFVLSAGEVASRRRRVHDLLPELLRAGVEVVLWSEASRLESAEALRGEVLVLAGARRTAAIAGLIERARARAIPVVYDLDADVAELKRLVLSAACRSRRACLLAADVVTCATSALAAQAEELGKPAFVVPSCSTSADPSARKALEAYEHGFALRRCAEAVAPERERWPLVSVVSVLYRREAQVRPFLDAFYAQDYPGAYELVFVDDRSPDRSVAVLHEHHAARRDRARCRERLPEVRVLANEENLGNCASRNRGIAEARGEVVVVIDADCVVNRSFLTEHVRAYRFGDCDVAIGHCGLETRGREPLGLIDAYERDLASVRRDAVPQDPLNPRSFLNCVTRNFSFRRDYLCGALFDDDFSYSTQPGSGFGWEDVEAGYRLYRRGARIRFLDRAFSLHLTHGPSVAEGSKPARSMKNFRLLLERHPELLDVARRWAHETFGKLREWLDAYGQGDNPDHRFLEQRFPRSTPAPFFIGRPRRLRVLSYRWHCAHQYELFKLPLDVTLVRGLGTFFSDTWRYEHRPLPANARFQDVDDVEPSGHDVAIMHFDENVLAPQNTCGVIPVHGGWGDAFKYFVSHVDVPKVAICHGTPQFRGQYDQTFVMGAEFEVLEAERRRLVDFLGDTLVVVNSHQAQREWGFKNSKVIWHGMDPAEFPPGERSGGVLVMGEAQMAARPFYNGYRFYQEVLRHLPAGIRPAPRLVPEPDARYDRRSNEYALARFENYVRQLGSYSVYLNTTLRSPMPRSRTEAMLAGLVSVSARNHDVELFVENGRNGFYGDEPEELAEHLTFLHEHPDARRRIGDASRRTACDVFNHDRFLRIWEATLADLAG